jgi:hypothetical protein
MVLFSNLIMSIKHIYLNIDYYNQNMSDNIDIRKHLRELSN